MNKAKIFDWVITLYLVLGLAPFAGFFNSVFNSGLLKLAPCPSTRWLSTYCLPHMILPQDIFLQFVRVIGSLPLVVGTAVFII